VIGSNGACDAFIAFSARDKQENDEEIKAFMHFFAEVFRHSRSQWAQDVFVMYASAMKVGGCYLEIGGADGLTHSNTLSLRDSLGWSGTLVEPDPDMHALLKAARGHSDQVIHAAISPSGTTGTGLLRRAGQLSALLGHEGLDIHSEERKHHETTAAVSLVSLTELIRSQPRIDYFSLDVEGAELSILESINWQDIVPPGLITVEHNFRTTEQDKLRSILLEQGYLEQFSDHDWLRKGDLWMRHKEYTP
jgi:FkbM family methyltransferase